MKRIVLLALLAVSCSASVAARAYEEPPGAVPGDCTVMHNQMTGAVVPRPFNDGDTDSDAYCHTVHPDWRSNARAVIEPVDGVDYSKRRPPSKRSHPTHYKTSDDCHWRTIEGRHVCIAN